MSRRPEINEESALLDRVMGRPAAGDKDRVGCGLRRRCSTSLSSSAGPADQMQHHCDYMNQMSYGAPIAFSTHAAHSLPHGASHQLHGAHNPSPSPEIRIKSTHGTPSATFGCCTEPSIIHCSRDGTFAHAIGIECLHASAHWNTFPTQHASTSPLPRSPCDASAPICSQNSQHCSIQQHLSLIHI